MGGTGSGEGTPPGPAPRQGEHDEHCDGNGREQRSASDDHCTRGARYPRSCRPRSPRAHRTHFPTEGRAGDVAGPPHCDGRRFVAEVQPVLRHDGGAGLSTRPPDRTRVRHRHRRIRTRTCVRVKSSGGSHGRRVTQGCVTPFGPASLTPYGDVSTPYSECVEQVFASGRLPG